MPVKSIHVNQLSFYVNHIMIYVNKKSFPVTVILFPVTSWDILSPTGTMWWHKTLACLCWKKKGSRMFSLLSRPKLKAAYFKILNTPNRLSWSIFYWSMQINTYSYRHGQQRRLPLLQREKAGMRGNINAWFCVEADTSSSAARFATAISFGYFL